MAHFENAQGLLTLGNLFYRDQTVRDNAERIRQASWSLGITTHRQETALRISQRKPVSLPEVTTTIPDRGADDTLSRAGMYARRVLLRPVLKLVSIVSTREKSETARFITMPLGRRGEGLLRLSSSTQARVA